MNKTYMIYFIPIIILIIIAWYLTQKIELRSERKYSSTTLDRPFLYGLISIFIWPAYFISFFLSAAVVIPLLIVIPPKNLLPIARFFSYLILFSSGVHLLTIGREKVDPYETYLWIFNHQSYLDSFIFIAVANQFVVTTGAAYQFKLPIWGLIMRRWGAIPIERSNIRQAYRSLQTAKDVLLNGSSVQILPEGKRTLDGKLGKFKNGPFRLAIDAKVPIIPMGIKGAYEIKKRTDWRFRPGRVTATIGDPIHPQEYADMSAKELSLYARDIIQKMIK